MDEGLLFEQNRPLAKRIAAGYRNIPGLEPEDVLSVAEQALHRAAQSFRPERGEFAPFANTAIRNALNTLHQQQRRHADQIHLDGDLAQGAEAAPSIIDYLIDTSADVVHQARRSEAREVLESELSKFPQRTRLILQGVAEGRSYSEIGQRLGISKQAANKAAQEAMAKIREDLYAAGYQGIDSQCVLFSSAKDSAPEPGTEGRIELPWWQRIWRMWRRR